MKYALCIVILLLVNPVLYGQAQKAAKPDQSTKNIAAAPDQVKASKAVPDQSAKASKKRSRSRRGLFGRRCN